MVDSQAGHLRSGQTARATQELADLYPSAGMSSLSTTQRVFGVRRGITSGGLVGPVTLGYSGSDHQHPGVRVPGVPRVGPARQVRGFCEPHRNPTSPRHGGRSP